MATLDKGMIRVLGGTDRRVRDLIVLLGEARSWKRVHCLFLEFSMEYFQTAVDHRSLKLQEVKPGIRGDSCSRREGEDS